MATELDEFLKEVWDAASIERMRRQSFLGKYLGIFNDEEDQKFRELLDSL